MIGVGDAPARAAAIDPRASFCVSAPAGSGKTELLIQRYLCLLSRVRRPEQILAITFTRKAAAEMRDRVLQALHSALAGTPCENLHQQVTRALAEQALAANERGGWNLLRDISRLNIKTIDSFCAGLTRQMPVLSQFGGQAELLDDATPLYIEAVQELYKLLEEHHPVADDLAALMLHFDNNWERLQALLVSMLARREQWRDYVGAHHAPQEAEAFLIATVESLVSEELRGLARLLTPIRTELLQLLQFAAANLAELVPTQLPGDAPRDLPGWRRIRQLLLTRNGSWRKAVNTRDGFPSGRGEAQHRKAQLMDILAQARQIDGLHSRLLTLQILPALEANSVSWQLVLHLSRLLPILAAQLLLVFRKRGVVDHSQVAHSALLALGDDDSPTELALRLDYQLEHILVDEFQDTAITQYELLHKLTRGWGEHNEQCPQTPRTLMIVGDGMQSIYGFRGANVGLFLRARQEGFNGVQLQHLELQCNFRSDQGVVDWINQTFSQAFPAQDDVFQAQVRYSPATAVRPPALQSPVDIHAFHGGAARAEEVAFICRHISDCIEREKGTIAVLGRSRSHLQPIIQRLKLLKISYNAPELDSLAESMVVADLLTLCRALANDADRVAWMALLRAPWCGMQLADLLAVARFGDAQPGTSVWSILRRPELHHALSAEGSMRLQHILFPLQQARQLRDRLGLRVWIEQAWIGLGGHQCAPDVASLQNAENFLQLLEQAETEGIGLDVEWLSRRLRQQYMSAGDPDSKVQLMTLHKAKGLEFDRVIIPQLDKLPRSDGRDILLWDEHSTAGGERAFLLAADDHYPEDTASLYNYLKAQRERKGLLEDTRLLYVGGTRAISHLLLTASVKWDPAEENPRDPPRRSLLRSIWPVFAQQMTVHRSASVQSPTAKSPAPMLTRLVRAALRPATPVATDLPPAAHKVALRPDNHVERSIGTVVHLALQELSRQQTLPATASDRDHARWRAALQRAGLQGEVLERSMREVHSSVGQTLSANGRGRWVLAAEHAEAHSEWALTALDAHGRVRDLVIDRSFIDRTTGERWLIDYKNSRPAPGEPLHMFATRECAVHMEQLRGYRDALRALGKEPLRCALFFTAMGHLHTVPELDLPALPEEVTCL